MKNIIIATIILLCIGCFTGVRFENPQPLSSFSQINIPIGVIGEYDQGQGDKLIVNESGIVFISKNKIEEYILDSNLILFNSMYGVYANLKDTIGFWNCFLIEYSDSSMKVSPINNKVEEVKSYANEYYYIEDSLLIISDIDYNNLYHLIDISSSDVYEKIKTIK